MNTPRALLLTDVVDSTQLSERLGDQAMAELWAAHDRVARDLLPVWRGREIDKTDGMLLLFDSADDAVHYAHGYHAALATLPVALKARAGLHVGPVILRENSAADVARGAKPLEVDGLVKPTAARVMSVAQGAQTLLTRQARDALVGTPPQIQSLGHWLMKGLAEPIELFEAVDAVDALDARSAFAAPLDGDKAYQVVHHGDQWRPVQEIANNLPQQVTSFIGREREVREIKAQLGTVRLLTLLGMGGLGKTRLSLRVATEVLARFPDGVWFIDLAPLRDAALVASEVAQVLGVREEPSRPLAQTLGAALKSRCTLLIFDNCEHLIKASADLAHTLLRAAPQLRILASSREALRVPGEQSYPVLPLPVPNRRDNLLTLSRSTAVRLFVERAQLHKPAFVLNEREAPAVAELVARLEGIPLALELAAARVRALSVADINVRLKDRYKLLTGGGRVLLERQQTLRALVDWSYELLLPHEQTMLKRLSIFAGGFDLAAAEAVCGAQPLSADDVLELLSSLVEKSLVMADNADGAMRYRMLETMRDYAAEKLAQSGDPATTLATTATRHCEHYFTVAKAVRDGLKGAEQAEWIWRGESELDNIRVAIALALAGGVDPFIVVKFSIAMMAFWTLRGYASEGRQTVCAALAMPGIQASDMAQAHALYVQACLAGSQNDHAQARQALQACLLLRRKLANPVEIAATLSALSRARLQAGDSVAASANESEALALYRSQGERLGEAISLLHLGEIAAYTGDSPLALSSLTDCLRIAQAIKNREVEGEAELALGVHALESGRPDDARRHLQRSFVVCSEAGDRRGSALAQWCLGRLDLQAGELAVAIGRLAETLQTFRDFEMREPLAECLEDHAVLAGRQGEPVTAVRVASAAQEYRLRFDLVRSPHSQRRWQQRFEALRASVPDAVFASAWEQGQNTGLDAAIRLAKDRATAPAVTRSVDLSPAAAQA